MKSNQIAEMKPVTELKSNRAKEMFEPGHRHSEHSKKPAKSQERTLVLSVPYCNKARIRSFENIVFFTPPRPSHSKKTVIRPVRGCVTEFSRKSRSNLFKVLAAVSHQYSSPPFFVSLTWHYGWDKPDFNPYDTLRRFIIELSRTYPELSYIWRLELQKRGAPHYHIMLFPPPDMKPETHKSIRLNVCSIWHKLADPNSKAHERYGADVREISSYRNACGYLAKYIAKESEMEKGTLTGRRWGLSDNLCTPCQIDMIMNDRQSAEFARIARLFFESRKTNYPAWFESITPRHRYTLYLNRNQVDLIVERLHELGNAYERDRSPTFS